MMTMVTCVFLFIYLNYRTNFFVNHEPMRKDKNEMFTHYSINKILNLDSMLFINSRMKLNNIVLKYTAQCLRSNKVLQLIRVPDYLLFLFSKNINHS